MKSLSDHPCQRDLPALTRPHALSPSAVGSDATVFACGAVPTVKKLCTTVVGLTALIALLLAGFGYATSITTNIWSVLTAVLVGWAGAAVERASAAVADVATVLTLGSAGDGCTGSRSADIWRATPATGHPRITLATVQCTAAPVQHSATVFTERGTCT